MELSATIASAIMLLLSVVGSRELESFKQTVLSVCRMLTVAFYER